MNNQVLLKGLILLCGVLVLITGVSFLTYYFFKRRNKQKSGKIAGFVMFTISISLAFYAIFGYPFFVIEDYYFFESTAIEKLKQVDIELEDDFKILENEVYEFMSYSHIFKLKISNKDVDRLIDNKKVSADKEIMVRFEEINAYHSKEVIIDTKDNLLIFRHEID